MISIDSKILFYALLLTSVILTGCERKGGQIESPKSFKIEQASFVSPELCIDCHREAYKAWKGSHHDLAMQVASDETVLADFNDSTFTYYDITSTFFNRDGKFFINTDGADGKLKDFEISYVFGITPLQQYLVKFPDGRYQALDIAWDSRPKEEGGQRWIHLHPDENITHDDPLHWIGLSLNWNYMCAECHSTNLQRNYDLKTDTYRTTWSEINVGCQGCHGPGSSHVEWAHAVEKGNAKVSDDDKGLYVDLGADDSHLQVEACARCHARRSIVSGTYKYGKDFMDMYEPQLLLEPYYYADGQILDEDYVYGSFIQSKKYHQGVRCTDCHNPHTARLRAEGNALCIRCHNPAKSKRFKTLKNKNYDTPEHHFHKAGESGASCVECHMPATNYMVVDPRHDHSFRIPRPDLTVKLKIPNACNRCHGDKSAKWAAEKINKWYPGSKAKREEEKQFAEIFAAAQAGETEVTTDLIGLAGDSSRPAIVRATVLNLLGRYSTPEVLELMTSSLKDKSPLVRLEAARGISAVLPQTFGEEFQKKKLSLLFSILNDSVRAVRSEAVRGLSEVPAKLFAQEQRQSFKKVLTEYKDRQKAMEERPESHLNLGMLYQDLGKIDLAEEEYKTAVRLADYFVPARFNLSNLYNAQGRNEEAEQLIREIIEKTPEYGEAHYSLGLLLAEMKRLKEAEDALAKATELMPKRIRVRYNYALVLQHLGKRKKAEGELKKAYQLDKSAVIIVNALTIFYLQENKLREALPYAKRLVELAPDAPEPKQMLEQLEQSMKIGNNR